MLFGNISLFGDSIGAGVKVDGDKRSFSKRSAVRLFEEKYSVSVDNRSKFGQTLAKTFLRKTFDNYVEEVNGGDNTVIIELGGNDSAYYWKIVAAQPEKHHDPVTPLKEFVDYYERALSTLTKKVKVFCCNLVPIDPKRYFDNVIGRICDKNKVLEFFNGDYTVIYRHHEMFNNAVVASCATKNVPVIDIRSPFLDTFDFSSLLCDDGIHPNDLGQQLIFSSVCDFVETRIKPRK